MSPQEPYESGYAALLVDVVDSRHHSDRSALQQAVFAAAAEVNRRVPCLDPLTSTVGDELQATYAQPSAAIRAIVDLRLELSGVAELRAGIGWGDISVHDPARSPFGQDGSAWWAAREALDNVAASTARSGYAARMGIQFAGRPTASGAAESHAQPARGGLPAPQPLTVDVGGMFRAMLALFDRTLAAVDPVEARIVLADLANTSTDDIAESLGLTPSAISQRRTRNHLRELVAALRFVDTAA